jgi:hypothetical protein
LNIPLSIKQPSRWDEETSTWIAENQYNPNFLATSKAPKASLLLGPQDWTIHNDSNACSKSQTYTARLKLTGCSDTEFTCADATCVPMTVRCDARGDCADGSDEANCKTVITSVGYNKFNVPPPAVETNNKLKLSLGIKLMQIVEINEREGYIKIKIEHKRCWIDKTLIYQNLKADKQHVLSPEDEALIWKPWTVLENIENQKKIVATDERPKMKITPNSDFNFEQADNTYIDNTYLFEGSENLLCYEKQRTVELLCDYNMMLYPFDVHSCKIEFKPTEDSVNLVAANFTYDGPLELSEHYVLDFKICEATVNGKRRVVAEVIFDRPLFAHILTTTVPTAILVMISQMATVFSDEYLDMVVQVNLTVLLVLATL